MARSSKNQLDIMVPGPKRTIVRCGGDRCSLYGKRSGRKKTGPKAGFFKQSKITSKQLEQQQLEQPKRQPKQQEQQRQQLERLEQQRQQLEQRLELEQQLGLQRLGLLLELVQELLLFSSKQPG
ncbi:MAG: hypothetical protein K2X55_23500 [Burkholderiaceae bacterium]|nr:hypothetical protein [Burkholderiaceae bacterium]